MKTNRKFYIRYLRLNHRLHTAWNKKRVAKATGRYALALADCFPVDNIYDGYNIMLSYHLIGSYIAYDDTSDMDIDYQKSNEILDGCSYVQSKEKTKHGWTRILRFPNKKVVFNYLHSLLQKAIEYTANSYDYKNLPRDLALEKWSNGSRLTPIELNHLLHASGKYLNTDFTNKITFHKFLAFVIKNEKKNYIKYEKNFKLSKEYVNC